jgi:hypothetical protein
MPRIFFLSALFIISQIASAGTSTPLEGCYAFGVKGSVAMNKSTLEIKKVGASKYRAYVNNVEFKLTNSEYRSDSQRCILTFSRPTDEQGLDEVVKLDFVDPTKGNCTELFLPIIPPVGNSIASSLISYGFQGRSNEARERVGTFLGNIFYQPFTNCTKN